MAEEDPGRTTEGDPSEAQSTSVLAWLGGCARSAAGACINSLARPEAGTLVFVLVCLAFAYRKTTKKKAAEPAKAAAAAGRPLLQRSVSMAVLHGGRAVIERIIDAQEARHGGDQVVADTSLAEMRRLLREPRMSFSKLSRNAAKLEMTGREDEAIELLQDALKKAEKEGKPHEAYELQMVLAEMLIYKGEYQQALDCKCLREREISDARVPLYQAIIYTIMGKKDRAKECYEEFQEIRRQFHLPETINKGSRLYFAVHDLREFEKLVANLKKEIEHARKTKARTPEITA